MKITKYGHSCLLIEEGGAKILIDPGAYSKGFEGVTGLGAVLITHQHADHLSAEHLAGLKAKNPEMKVYADEGSVGVLDGGDMPVEAVHSGEEIGKKFFYPGDNFTEPGEPVAVLAVPAGAPWLKISEAIDYMVAVHPEVAIPVHDAVLAIPEMNYGLLKRFAEPVGIEVRVVPNGETTEV
jgi:L-ascorbate metabolism protein UlaG (beta-lactamase superfamily)